MGDLRRMPPRNTPPEIGGMGEAAKLQPGEAYVAAAFIADSGRVVTWNSNDVETAEHWDWLLQMLEKARGQFMKQRAHALRTNGER